MKTSLRFNNDIGVDQFIEVAQLAESLGFDQIWVSNDLFLRSAPVVLATAARHTRSIALGTCILNPYSIHPAEIAMMAATLHEASGGRFRLGLAAGAEEFLEWAGIARPAPLARTRDAILAIRALLAGQRPADVLPNAGWREGARMRIPAAPVPIYVGGMSPRMLDLAGEIGDGVLPLLFPPEHFAIAAAQVRAGAERADRRLEDIDLAACIWCSIDPDGDRARHALAEKIAYYGPSFAPYLLERAGLSPADFADIRKSVAAGDVAGATRRVTATMMSLGIAGSADDVLTRCRGLIALGARHLSFGPPLGPDPIQAVQTLGTHVLPGLSSLVR
jgi:5,10-methylenetetrahydromethanopterin reductase